MKHCSIIEAVKKLIIKGYSVASMHIEYIYPFTNGIRGIISNFDRIMIPEINNGQLSNILRDKFLIYPRALNKIKGITFTVSDIINKVYQVLLYIKYMPNGKKRKKKKISTHKRKKRSRKNRHKTKK